MLHALILILILIPSQMEDRLASRSFVSFHLSLVFHRSNEHRFCKVRNELEIEKLRFKF